MSPKSAGKCLQEKRRGADLRGACHAPAEAEVGVMYLYPKSCQPEAGREAWDGSSPTASQRSQPCQCLDFGLLVSETVREYISVVLSPLLCGVLLWKAQETNT